MKQSKQQLDCAVPGAISYECNATLQEIVAFALEQPMPGNSVSKVLSDDLENDRFRNTTAGKREWYANDAAESVEALLLPVQKSEKHAEASAWPISKQRGPGYRERKRKRAQTRDKQKQNEEKEAALAMQASASSGVFRTTPQSVQTRPQDAADLAAIEAYVREHLKTFTKDELAAGLFIESSDGHLLLYLAPVDMIPSKDSKALETAFHEFEAASAVPAGQQDPNRFLNEDFSALKCLVRHIGCWRKANWYGKQPAMSTEYRGRRFPNYKTEDNLHHRYIKSLLEAGRPAFHAINQAFRRHFPQAYKIYNEIQLLEGQHKIPGTAYCMLVTNRNAVSSRHRDTGDPEWGICAVMPVGDWESGGELVFEELGIFLPIQAGQVCFFRSAILTHWNLSLKGKGARDSFVLFTDKGMFKWWKEFKHLVAEISEARRQ